MSEAEKDAEIARLRQLTVHQSELLEDLARRTWHRILDGHYLDIPQGETTITDYHLLEIARGDFPNIEIMKTSSRKEARQGTDWEWLVGLPSGGWIRYAIQAKRLYPKGVYHKLRHKVGTRRQVDILINYAKKKNAVSLYCFYNAINESSAEKYWKCCSMPFQPEQLGCTLVHAKDIQAFLSISAPRTFEEICSRYKVLPWRCLVCCPRILSQCRGDLQGKSGEAPFFPMPKVHNERPKEFVPVDDIGDDTEAYRVIARHPLIRKSRKRFFDGVPSAIPSFSPRYRAVIGISESSRETSARE
jgi:hypothetical protein